MKKLFATLVAMVMMVMLTFNVFAAPPTITPYVGTYCPDGPVIKNNEVVGRLTPADATAKMKKSLTYADGSYIFYNGYIYDYVGDETYIHTTALGVSYPVYEMIIVTGPTSFSYMAQCMDDTIYYPCSWIG